VYEIALLEVGSMERMLCWYRIDEKHADDGVLIVVVGSVD
jgi:hypothetical protein